MNDVKTMSDEELIGEIIRTAAAPYLCHRYDESRAEILSRMSHAPKSKTLGRRVAEEWKQARLPSISLDLDDLSSRIDSEIAAAVEEARKLDHIGDANKMVEPSPGQRIVDEVDADLRDIRKPMLSHTSRDLLKARIDAALARQACPTPKA